LSKVADLCYHNIKIKLEKLINFDVTDKMINMIVKGNLVMSFVIGSMIFLTLSLYQGSFAENSTFLHEQFNTTEKSWNSMNQQPVDKEKALSNLPLVINITKNSNATDTVIDFIINQVNSSVVDTSILEDLARDRIPLLIDTLKNTNASSIAAEYVINETKEGLITNITGN
jgi:hypothetical protein